MYRKLLEFSEGEAVVGVAATEAEDDSSDDGDGGDEVEGGEDDGTEDKDGDDDDDDEEEEEEVDASLYLMDSDVEYDAPKNALHSFCRLCPGIVLKNEAAVQDHVKSKVHVKRETEYRRVQREFNARIFGGGGGVERESDDASPATGGDAPDKVLKSREGTAHKSRGEFAAQGGRSTPKKEAEEDEGHERQKGRVKRKKEDARLKKDDAEGKHANKKQKLEDKIAHRKSQFQAKKARRLARRADKQRSVEGAAKGDGSM